MHDISMVILAVGMWGSTFWLLGSDSGNRYAEAQRMNVGNCWPSCPPIPESYEVTTTIIKKGR